MKYHSVLQNLHFKNTMYTKQFHSKTLWLQDVLDFFKNSFQFFSSQNSQDCYCQTKQNLDISIQAQSQEYLFLNSSSFFSSLWPYYYRWIRSCKWADCTRCDFISKHDLPENTNATSNCFVWSTARGVV